MPTASTATEGAVVVEALPKGASFSPFIEVAWTFNRDDPNWIPPLRMSVRTALNRAKHPFHEHAEVEYFLARRNGKVVGRIAAIVNHAHNEFHEDSVGFFGLFECERSQPTADALFDAAGSWLRDRGMTSMQGPMNFSTNEEIASPGILIDGFDSKPTLMMTHNPRYYEELHEAGGFDKAKDLLAFYLESSQKKPERGAALIDRLLAREGATIRTLDLKRFDQDVDAIKEVYNSAWSKNWGFVPMTDAEFDHLAKEFRPFVDPDLCLIAEGPDGEPLGFSLSLPDLNQAIRHLPDGRLFPFGLFRFLWHRRKIDGIRVLTLGFKPKLHRAGLGIGFYLKTWDNGVAKGYVRGEASWILEDNHEMVRALERMGGRPYRRYRIYERPLG